MTLTWDESVNGKVNEERTATLTFKNNDVRAVYIDWDDGESNKKEEANYQWVELTEPKSSIEVKHTYNKSGTFKPVVQLINSRGFVSRYYANETSNTAITPFSQDTGIQTCKANDDTPTAIMKVENTLSDSGIDNSILEIEGPKKLYIAIAPTLTRTELTGTLKQVSLEVEAVSHRNKYDARSGVDSQIALGSVAKQETFAFDINLTSAANQYGVYDFHTAIGDQTNLTFSKVLKFKYVSCKATGTTAANAGTDYTTNEIFNRLKIFLVTKAADGKFYPITYVSAGSPVKTVDDQRRYVTLDMGQSRAAASNISISDNRFDNGKGWFSPVNQWSLSTNILGTGTSIGTTTTQPLHYSYLTNPDGLNNIAAQAMFGVAGGATEYTWYITGTTSGNIRQDTVTKESGEAWHLIQCLAGDQTDGYGGVPGIGVKRAETLFNKEGYSWKTVVKAFKDKDLTEEDALVNARLARILTVDDYDFTKNRPILWSPSSDYRVNVGAGSKDEDN